MLESLVALSVFACVNGGHAEGKGVRRRAGATLEPGMLLTS